MGNGKIISCQESTDLLTERKGAREEEREREKGREGEGGS